MDDKLIDVKQFVEDQIIIGSQADVHLNLRGSSVAHFHAMIERRGSQYFIVDLGSQSGTFKNNEKVLESSIQSGDSFRIGQYKVKIFIGIPKPISGSKKEVPLERVPSEEIPLKKESHKIGFEKEDAFETVVAQLDEGEEKDGGEKKESKESESKEIFSRPLTDSLAPSIVQPFIKEEKGREEEKTAVVEEKKIVKNSVQSLKVLKSSAAIHSSLEEIEEETPLRLHFPFEANKTFAPPSGIQDVREIIHPGKGSTIEVIVVWKERILKVYHFYKKSSITIGYSDDYDITIPLLNVSKHKHTLMKIGSLATIYIHKDMSGDYTFKNKNVASFDDLIQSDMIKKTFGGYKFELRQGEMARIGFQNKLVSVFIRYTTGTSKPSPSSALFGFTGMETAGIFLSVIAVFLLSFYLSIYTPTQKEVVKPVVLRKAFISWNLEKKKPPEKPKKVAKMTPPPSPPPVAVKSPPPSLRPKPSSLKKSSRSKVVKQMRKTKKRNKLKKKVAINKRVFKKKIKKKAIKVERVKKDPTKVGLLSVFGTKGTQKKLSQLHSGSSNIKEALRFKKGDVQDEVAPDSVLDLRGKSSLSSVDKSGKNLKTISIGKVRTDRGRKEGYGQSNTPLSFKSETSFVDFQGREAEFSGVIDREAIRRVIQMNKGAIKGCYDLALNRNEKLYGKLVLHWDIEEDGKVARSGVVENTLKDKLMVRCILNRLKLWKFPLPPRGQIGRVVGYPFVFTAK